MFSFGDKNKRWARCPACAKDTKVSTHFELLRKSSDSQNNDIDEFYVFECGGCETVFFCKSSNNEANLHELTNERGEYDRAYRWSRDYLPKCTLPQFPTLPPLPLAFISPHINEVLRETYATAEAGHFILAATGVRTSFDVVATFLGIDSNLPFTQKLEKLRQEGRISDTDKSALEVLIDAGGAAAHRGWRPDETQVRILIETLNQFIQAQVLLPREIKIVKDVVPKRMSKLPT